MADRREHPVLWGLVALVTVAAAIGLFLGLGALAATNVLGLRGGDAGSAASNEASMYLPKPEKTTASPTEASSPAGEGSASPSAPSASASTKPPKTKQPKPIQLVSGQTRVSPMQRIDLTGTYSRGDGAILQVQRFENGTWTSFPVTASVSGDSFSTYVQTGRSGPNKFRVIDTDNGKVSNPVTVTVG